MRSLIVSSQLNQNVYDEAVRQSLIAFSAYGPVLLTGDQTINGIKTFIQLPQISGAGFVACTGGQTIGGNKTFTNNIYIDQIWSKTGNSYINYKDCGLYDKNGLISLDWHNKQFTGKWYFQSQPGLSGAEFVLTTGNQIIGGGKTFTNGVAFLSPINLVAGSPLNGQSPNFFQINVTNGVISSFGNSIINWSGKQLTGDWQCNVNPTLPYHLINKNYLDGNSSNLVKLTGNQTISGLKTFSGIMVNIMPGSTDFRVSAATFNAISLHSGSHPTLDPTLFILKNAPSNTVLSWFDQPTLSGNWITNTFPEQSGHLINYGYISGRYISGSGNATPPSNTAIPVTWCDTWVSGIKYKTPLYL